MQIFLANPEHGLKIAEMREEADRDLKNGWQEITQEEWLNHPIRGNNVTSFN